MLATSVGTGLIILLALGLFAFYRVQIEKKYSCRTRKFLLELMDFSLQDQSSIISQRWSRGDVHSEICCRDLNPPPESEKGGAQAKILKETLGKKSPDKGFEHTQDVSRAD